MPYADDASLGRSGYRWRQLQLQVYAEERLCWLCGQPVDQRLDPRHRMSKTVDHLVQLQHGGPPLVRSGCRLAHRACNSTRSNRLRNLAIEDCACSDGRPCARLSPHYPRGYVAVDPRSV
ncbi:HNH endonuclease [Amycolatopsis kentuckyensis]|uniref:HNH endonuclease n=1 Tax=Amycolatopsis kentuckyensis TaxID=218823 RepID=UPI000A39A3B0